MKRINLRDVPDEVYATLSEAAAANRQSLNAYVVDRLAEAARVVRLAGYLGEFSAMAESTVRLEDAVATVREGRQARHPSADLASISRRPAELTSAEIIKDVRGG